MATLRTKALGPFTGQTCVVACSGGVDSVALLHFMVRHNNVRVLHVNHNPGNKYDDDCEALVRKLANSYCVEIDVHYIREQYTNNVEKQWREFRQKLYRAYDCSVYLAHSLDDQVEEYIMSMLKGRIRFITPSRNNLRRPFLFLTKKEIYAYAQENKLTWYEDPTNYDGSNQRSICRNTIVPQALLINPGLYKTVSRLSHEEFSRLV